MITSLRGRTRRSSLWLWISWQIWGASAKVAGRMRRSLFISLLFKAEPGAEVSTTVLAVYVTVGLFVCGIVEFKFFIVQTAFELFDAP